MVFSLFIQFQPHEHQLLPAAVPGTKAPGIPAVLGKLMEIMPYIKRVLSTNTELEYQEFNSLIYKNSNRLMGWLDQAEYYFDRCCYEVNRRQIRFADLKVDVRDYLLNPDKYQLRHKL